MSINLQPGEELVAEASFNPAWKKYSLVTSMIAMVFAGGGDCSAAPACFPSHPRIQYAAHSAWHTWVESIRCRRNAECPCHRRRRARHAGNGCVTARIFAGAAYGATQGHGRHGRPAAGRISHADLRCGAQAHHLARLDRR